MPEFYDQEPPIREGWKRVILRLLMLAAIAYVGLAAWSASRLHVWQRFDWSLEGLRPA